MKLALVVGSAACMWNDVAAARELYTFDKVYCVKRVGIHWPYRFDVWVTLHPEFMDKYEAQRAAAGLPNGYEIVAPLSNEVGMHGKKGNVKRRVSYRYPGMSSSAGSGGYAIKVALDDGYRVVLAGIPMDKTPHFCAHELWKAGNWEGRDSFMPGFMKQVPHMLGKVKSMSGHTREILGAPSPEWLAGERP